MQPNGKIVIAGYSSDSNYTHYSCLVARMNEDGSPDASFGQQGYILDSVAGNTRNFAYSVALQADGKIVVVGITQPGLNNPTKMVIARYNTNGTPDHSFNGSGKILAALGSTDDEAFCVKIQNDGKILVSGYTTNANNKKLFALLRYNTNGNLDASFNGSGIVTTSIQGAPSADYANAIALQSDGKILQGGTSNGNIFAVVRYNTDGSIDNSFNGNGITTVQLGTPAGNSVPDLLIQSDNKIVVAATMTSTMCKYPAVIRFNSNGTIDNTFNNTGTFTASYMIPQNYCYVPLGDGMLQSNHKMILAGARINPSVGGMDHLLLRINEDGSVDNSFGTNGEIVSSYPYNQNYINAAKLINNRIYAAGNVGFAASVTAYTDSINSESVPSTMAHNSENIYPNPATNSINITIPKVTTPANIYIYDVQGRLLQKTQAAPNTSVAIVNVANLPAGLYIAQCRQETGVTLYKFIKE
jgi:uncharacterized delta-60 repeat protein